MAAFLSDVTPRGGKPPQVGDSDDGFVIRFEPTWPSNPYGDVLSAVSLIFARPDLLKTSKHPSQKAFWYSMIIGTLPRVIENKHDNVTATVYPYVYAEGGYTVLGDSAVHLIFDTGPLGYLSIAAHGHADALSFCLALEGHWWLIDPGNYSYFKELNYRSYFRGTTAHNTLKVDRRDQSEIGGPFLWLKHGTANLTKVVVNAQGVQSASGYCNGYRGLGVLHCREIRFNPHQRRIEVHDVMHGWGEHDFELHYHFSPEISITPATDGKRWIANRTGSSALLVFEVNANWQWNVVQGATNPILGWYSPVLGKKQPCSTLQGTWSGRAPARVMTVIKYILLDHPTP
jgi:hypothetical protein